MRQQAQNRAARKAGGPWRRLHPSLLLPHVLAPAASFPSKQGSACAPWPPQLVKDYVASGRLEKEVSFETDDKILAQVAAA